mmetsp:Transcript_19303/g.43480  ORF Transcript_19303/g.43480 Transcript_19303/m.43480 type:complete len:229 (-) Transcript_19303:159-845(-)
MVAKAACGGEAENWWSLSRHERSLDAPAKKDGVGAAGCTSGEGKKQSALWDGASAVQVETSTRLDGAECCDGKGRPTQTAGGENNAGAPPRSLTPQLGAIGAVGGEAGSLAPPPLEGVTRHPPFPARNRTRHPVSRPVSFPIPFRTRHRASRPVSCPVCVLQTPPSLGAIGALGPEPQSGHWERTSRKGPLSSHRGKGIWSPLRDLSSPRAETQSGDLSTRRARLRTG